VSLAGATSAISHTDISVPAGNRLSGRNDNKLVDKGSKNNPTTKSLPQVIVLLTILLAT
jgi:hypothetical protein